MKVTVDIYDKDNQKITPVTHRDVDEVVYYDDQVELIYRGPYARHLIYPKNTIAAVIEQRDE